MHKANRIKCSMSKLIEGKVKTYRKEENNQCPPPPRDLVSGKQNIR
jgi:hypothetical protein